MDDLGQEGGHQEQQCAEGLSPFNPYWAWICSSSLLISHGEKHPPEGQSLKERHHARLHVTLLAAVAARLAGRLQQFPFPGLPLSGHLGKQVTGTSRSAGRTTLLPNQISPPGTSPAEPKLPITFPAEALILQTEGCLLPDK